MSEFFINCTRINSCGKKIENGRQSIRSCASTTNEVSRNLRGGQFQDIPNILSRLADQMESLAVKCGKLGDSLCDISEQYRLTESRITESVGTEENPGKGSASFGSIPVFQVLPGISLQNPTKTLTAVKTQRLIIAHIIPLILPKLPVVIVPKRLIPPMKEIPEPSRRRPSAPGNRRPSAPGNRRPSAPGNRRPSAPGNRRPPAPGNRRPPAPGDRRPPAPGNRRPGGGITLRVDERRLKALRGPEIPPAQKPEIKVRRLTQGEINLNISMVSLKK